MPANVVVGTRYVAPKMFKVAVVSGVGTPECWRGRGPDVMRQRRGPMPKTAAGRRPGVAAPRRSRLRKAQRNTRVPRPGITDSWNCLRAALPENILGGAASRPKFSPRGDSTTTTRPLSSLQYLGRRERQEGPFPHPGFSRLRLDLPTKISSTQGNPRLRGYLGTPRSGPN